MTLHCNHSFNYYHLYHEVVSQKYSTNKYSFNAIKDSIVCPYCKSITNRLLPPSIDLGCDSKNYVNSITSCLDIQCQIKRCKWRPLYMTPIGRYCVDHYSDENKKMGNKPVFEIDIVKTHKTDNFIKMANVAAKKTKPNNMSGDNLANIKLQYKTTHTLESMKQILSDNSKPISGNKTQLTDRIFTYNLQTQ